MANSKKAKFLKKHEDEQKNIAITVNDSYPKFSFAFSFESDRSFDNLDKPSKLCLIEKVAFLSKNTWADIKGLPREQGFEKIDKNSFKKLPNVPVRFKDENKITVFRLPSNKGRLIGYTEDDTFFVVWIDTKFDMYKH
ncbi:hypothetical protein AB6C62_06015 [Vibrio splendidus]|uniref:hypothetical protein n=1 Tax=Vibrio splendidus TaxID=29497 RepID=UPI000C85BAAC|nr:hypothetical protein [Vibrio splendidus]PMO23529.1 hypothetical protein BCT15_02535 [Vibrio splendidus]